MRMLGICALLVLAMSDTARGQSIDYIAGTTEITGLSADGRSASGRQNLGAIFWSRETGRYRVAGDLGGASAAHAISGDGRIVTGDRVISGNEAEAFLWSGPGSWRGLGHTPNTTGAVGNGLNWNGSIMAGTAYVGFNYTVAVRWADDTGMQVIGPLPGDAWSEAKGISRDGSTIVGWSGGQFANGFIWTVDGGIRRLERLGGAMGNTYAMGVNADGSHIVGQSGAWGQMAIWRDGRAELLAPEGFGEFSSIGKAVSDDGGVVVGTLNRVRDQAAAIWTLGRGFEELATFLTFHGVTLDPSWTLADCTSVSADGMTFGGYAINSSRERIGYVVTIPTPASGLVLLGVAFRANRRHRSNRSI